MSAEGHKFFPGDEASPQQVFELADEYCRAAKQLRESASPKRPLSCAPFRLAAIHAVELYFNAFLRMRGVSSSTLRGMKHDLTLRRVKADGKGLKLKKKTAEHLDMMSKTREYLVMRYGPELTVAVPPLNRTEATLTEVAHKVSEHFKTKA